MNGGHTTATAVGGDFAQSRHIGLHIVTVHPDLPRITEQCLVDGIFLFGITGAKHRQLHQRGHSGIGLALRCGMHLFAGIHLFDGKIVVGQRRETVQHDGGYLTGFFKRR